MKKWLKEMIEDKDMWGWLMVFASAPFLFFGMIFQYDFDLSIYVSYVGGALAIVRFLYSAFKY